MRHVMASLACIPDEGTEVSSAPDLEASSVGCAMVRVAGGSTAGGAAGGWRQWEPQHASMRRRQ
jgi:hypothetical protein